MLLFSLCPFSLIEVLALLFLFFFLNDTAPTEIYTLSLHDALPIFGRVPGQARPVAEESGLPRAGGDRQGNRPPQARRHRCQHRPAHEGAGEVPRVVGHGHVTPPVIASRSCEPSAKQAAKQSSRFRSDVKGYRDTPSPNPGTDLRRGAPACAPGCSD